MEKHRHMKPLRLFALLLCALAYVGCTSSEKAPSDSKPAATSEAKPEAPAPKAAEAEPAGNIVVLLGSDNMQFNTKEIRVKAGGKTTVNLTHTGQLPAESMGHNFVLLKQGVDLATYATKALEAKETQYIPAGDEALAYTNVIGGGEATSVTFDTPPPGTYTFLCTFPGHYAMMNGKFIVE